MNFMLLWCIQEVWEEVIMQPMPSTRLPKDQNGFIFLIATGKKLVWKVWLQLRRICCSIQEFSNNFKMV